MDKTVRCTRCESEFTDEELVDVAACPVCSSKGVPQSIQEDVQILINWHELRILGCWAEMWALQHKDKDPEMMEVLHTIVNRLERQHVGRTPLTLTREIKEIPNATLYSPNGEKLAVGIKKSDN